MNNPKALAVYVANKELAEAWQMEAITRAVGERWPKTLAGAYRLLKQEAASLSALISATARFDEAEMTKTDTAAALWAAAICAYNQHNHAQMFGAENTRALSMRELLAMAQEMGGDVLPEEAEAEAEPAEEVTDDDAE